MLTGQTVCHKLSTALLLHPEYSISSEKITVTAARAYSRAYSAQVGLPTLSQCCFNVGLMSTTVDQQ